MKRRIVHFAWENEDAQEAFAEWVPFPDARASAQDVSDIEALTGIAPPLDILDVGCGNARHAIEFARGGYRVVGIDVAKRFLDEAERRAQDAGVEIELRRQRAADIPERSAFDFALAYWHTIGFMSEKETRRHFTAIRAALRPGGVLLYTFQGPKAIPGQSPEPVRNWKEQEGKYILSEKSFADGYRDEYCVVIDTKRDEIVEYKEHQRAVGLREVLDYLQGAGFDSVEAYRDFDRTPATPEEFSVFLCKKGLIANP